MQEERESVGESSEEELERRLAEHFPPSKGLHVTRSPTLAKQQCISSAHFPDRTSLKQRLQEEEGEGEMEAGRGTSVLGGRVATLQTRKVCVCKCASVTRLPCRARKRKSNRMSASTEQRGARLGAPPPPSCNTREGKQCTGEVTGSNDLTLKLCSLKKKNLHSCYYKS